MKIVIDARESGTTSGRYLDKLLEYLMQIDGKNTYVLLLKKHRLQNYGELPDNFTVQECNIKEFTFAEQLSFAVILYRLRPNLVFFPMVHQPMLYFGKTVTTMQDLTTLRFRNPTKNPIIFWIKHKAYWLVNFWAAHKSTQLIAISEYTKKDVMHTLWLRNPDKITVTLESADFIEDTPVVVDPLVGKKFITYVGRHLPHKNLPRLIEAHQLLLKTYPDLILAIVGKKDTTTELLITQNSKLKTQNLLFTGFVTDAQLRWLYEHTTCYVFPSLSEGFGLPGLEAMKHGAPVASSNATCLPEVYGDACLYFDPLNTQDIADKISMVLSDKKLAQELVAKGYKQAAKYSWQRMAEQTLAVYNSP